MSLHCPLVLIVFLSRFRATKQLAKLFFSRFVTEMFFWLYFSSSHLIFLWWYQIFLSTKVTALLKMYHLFRLPRTYMSDTSTFQFFLSYHWNIIFLLARAVFHCFIFWKTKKYFSYSLDTFLPLTVPGVYLFFFFFFFFSLK